MQVRDLMSKEVDAVAPLTSVRDAARRMKELQTSLLPVATDTGLIGMLTATDIAVRLTAEGRDPQSTPVEDVMSLGVVVCFEDQDVREALATMARKHISQVPVLNRGRRLVGRFSVEDLVFRSNALRGTEVALNLPLCEESEGRERDSAASNSNT